MVIDRRSRKPLMMVSPAGGIDIEEVARTTPEKIIKVVVDPIFGILPFQMRRMTSALSGDKEIAKKVGAILASLYKAFMTVDASLAEINPLVVTPRGRGLGDRREDQHRRQRALPARRRRRAAGRIVRGPRRGRGAGGGAVVRQARRNDRLHRERRRPRDGDDGHDQTFRGRARQLPRYRRLVEPDKVLSAMKIILRDGNVKTLRSHASSTMGRRSHPVERG